MSLHIVPLGHRNSLPANKTETFDLWKITLPPNHDEFFFLLFLEVSLRATRAGPVLATPDLEDVVQ